LIELKHVRNLHQIIAVLFQIEIKIEQRFDVGIHAFALGVGDEDYSVDSLQNKLPACVVKDLARNGIQMKSSLESADGTQIERQKIEEQGAIRLGCETDQLSLGLRGGRIVDVLQIGCFSTQSWAVINNLAVDFARCVVDERQGRILTCRYAGEVGAAPGPSRSLQGHFTISHTRYLNNASMSSSVISANGESSDIPLSCSDFESIEVKIDFISFVARFTLSLTSPRLDRSSKITTRITRAATIDM